jgi:hypothetical protein
MNDLIWTLAEHHRAACLPLSSAREHAGWAGGRRRHRPAAVRGIQGCLERLGVTTTAPGHLFENGTKGGRMAVNRRGGGIGGISLGGILVIVGIVVAIVWSLWLGLIIALIGLIAFGGFARGRWY